MPNMPFGVIALKQRGLSDARTPNGATLFAGSEAGDPSTSR